MDKKTIPESGRVSETSALCEININEHDIIKAKIELERKMKSFLDFKFPLDEMENFIVCEDINCIETECKIMEAIEERKNLLGALREKYKNKTDKDPKIELLYSRMGDEKRDFELQFLINLKTLLEEYRNLIDNCLSKLPIDLKDINTWYEQWVNKTDHPDPTPIAQSPALAGGETKKEAEPVPPLAGISELIRKGNLAEDGRTVQSGTLNDVAAYLKHKGVVISKKLIQKTFRQANGKPYSESAIIRAVNYANTN